MIELSAHAKLTLSLRITGVRDDGYHLIDAEMISLDLADLIRIDPDGQGIAVTGRFGRGVPVDGRNLVAKALRLAGRTAHVTIDKRIPHGGGLGGGSTDAASVLAWAGVDDHSSRRSSAPTSPSASSVVAPECRASVRSSRHFRPNDAT